MVCEFQWAGATQRADLNRPTDLSLVLKANGAPNPSAWYVDSPSIEPVRANGFVGAVQEGGSVNFRTITFNPHGHGTHTECLGHITPTVHSVDQVFRNQPQHFACWVLSVTPQGRPNGDWVVGMEALDAMPDGHWPEALVIRTLPNDQDKQTRAWSDTNPPYFEETVLHALVERGVKHLLVDLPSIDRERDKGRLLGHHAFFGVPHSPRHDASITEFIFVPERVSDGLHLLCLAVGAIDNDASNSRPVIYPLL